MFFFFFTQSVDWEAHPALHIFSQTATHYLVSRQGLPTSDYGTVSIADVKRSHGDQVTPGRQTCPITREQVTEYESYCRQVDIDRAAVSRDSLTNLENLPVGSNLECMALLKAMRAPGGELRYSRDSNDADAVIPIRALSRIMQRVMDIALDAQRRKFDEERATLEAKIAELSIEQ